MLPFRRFYGFESWLDHDSSASFIKKPLELDAARAKTDRKSSQACKSHREAERRRRHRINSHLSTLRSLLPNVAKSDKASLLGEVVEHVKRLRKEADEVTCGESSSSRSGEPGSVMSEAWPFPGECDEATVSYCEGEARRVKATLCCEDRAGLNRDVTQAIRSVRAKVVRAEMMTVGGRTKSVVVVEWPREGKEKDVMEMEGKEVGALERALKAVVENRALLGYGMGPINVGQKRGRDSSASPSSDLDSDFLLGNGNNFC